MFLLGLTQFDKPFFTVHVLTNLSDNLNSAGLHILLIILQAPKKKKKLKSKKERDRVREGTKDATKKSGDKQASGVSEVLNSSISTFGPFFM